MSETTERFVIKSRAEMVEGEPCVDTCRERKPLENELGEFRRRGGNYSGRVFFMEPADQWAIVDLHDDWHRTNVEEIPEDPEELAILICAIAASTPAYRESYTSDLCDALGTDVHSEAYQIAFDAWEAADGRTERTGDEDVDAEAHAALVEARDRDHAAIILSTMAHDHAAFDAGATFVYSLWCNAVYSLWCNAEAIVGTSPSRAESLACLAIGEAIRRFPHDPRRPEHDGRGSVFWCLEAEALIRDGWSPE